MKIDNFETLVHTAFGELALPDPEEVFDQSEVRTEGWTLKGDFFHKHLGGRHWSEITYNVANKIRPAILKPKVYSYYIQSQLLPKFGKIGPGVSPVEAGLTRWESIEGSVKAIRLAESHTSSLDMSRPTHRSLSRTIEQSHEGYPSLAASVRRCRFGNSTYPLYFENLSELLTEDQLRALALYVAIYASLGDAESELALSEYWSRYL